MEKNHIFSTWIKVGMVSKSFIHSSIPGLGIITVAAFCRCLKIKELIKISVSTDLTQSSGTQYFSIIVL